jgi:hypothetical protein
MRPVLSQCGFNTHSPVSAKRSLLGFMAYVPRCSVRSACEPPAVDGDRGTVDVGRGV